MGNPQTLEQVEEAPVPLGARLEVQRFDHEAEDSQPMGENLKVIVFPLTNAILLATTKIEMPEIYLKTNLNRLEGDVFSGIGPRPPKVILAT